MDKINRLSDDVLVKILLFLPTKAAVSTSVLSKRWEHLWMWLPKLDFEDGLYSKSKWKRLRCFIDRNLPLHKAPVIESLRLKFYFYPEDVRQWIVIAVSRYVRELEITCSSYPNILPSCLYTCESLVILKLYGNILLDVPPTVGLPFLKNLQLESIVHFNEESLQRLLSSCPILEDLVVDFRSDSDKMIKFSIIVPSLQSLSLFIRGYFAEFVINTPSLKYFKLEDQSEELHSCSIENMPKLREAYVDVEYLDIDSFIGSITSVKSLTLCVKYSGLKAGYDDGFVFNQLEHLKLCVCQEFDILVRFLKHCPSLRELDDFGLKDHNFDFVSTWHKPTIVPECISSNLQFFNWSTYFRSPDERKLLAYILKNAPCLKKATILMIDSCVPKLKMIKELAFSS